jgi:hypothetical protein
LKPAESQAEVQRGQEREGLLMAEVALLNKQLKKFKARVVELEVCRLPRSGRSLTTKRKLIGPSVKKRNVD